MTHPRKHLQRGFSLLELAIALAVLAILAGGVLKGRELLNSARVQATMTDIANLETALSAFQARYSALPGDFIAASAAGLSNNGGDGNGLIEGDETCNVFTHLQLSGFIQGDFTGGSDESGNCTASSTMGNQFSGQYLLSNQLQGPNSRENAMALLIGETIPVAQLAEIDRKLDDGNPLRGAVQVLRGEEDLCTTGAGQWDEAQGADCAALYIIR
ncbi:type II secretion system protein [Limnobacter sp.]|uniref:type II secretion system protein n=1 Tax=Limnobacter sp. TaxID=2003368 RepID=UPI0025BC093E|nr:prepilin-type N-terminal cleavage/methylation domain-containing protein [Limnobacter sp.]MDP3270891.1 prepilin-type N-terminal cleavage/methylation domain-containing protein [Limnobacter sp.]MDZ4048755.1 prepilin-type N-terminal cleavage/methylation domain-containing protein [Limnobacter sp.]